MSGEMIMFCAFTSSKSCPVSSAAKLLQLRTGPLKFNFLSRRSISMRCWQNWDLAEQEEDLVRRDVQHGQFDHRDKIKMVVLPLKSSIRLKHVWVRPICGYVQYGCDPNKVDFNIFKMQYDNGVNLWRMFNL